ncbi:hypothetical protein Pla52n_03630 [Stieleria varia]|uniref:Uncharacterized protein n=1 Tax=Stieleria varia TaxID=2528005 RepID=A0A5C6B901_9BACT|nr:hypothetical protein Pla52n_03630 [Stieleria varia]
MLDMTPSVYCNAVVLELSGSYPESGRPSVWRGVPDFVMHGMTYDCFCGRLRGREKW